MRKVSGSFLYIVRVFQKGLSLCMDNLYQNDTWIYFVLFLIFYAVLTFFTQKNTPFQETSFYFFTCLPKREHIMPKPEAVGL